MPTVSELTALYSNFMLAPRPGPGVCIDCSNLTVGYSRCFACARIEPALDAVVPISYSVAGEQLHRALAGYKRFGGTVARRLQVELAAVLWRFLASHEPCVAAAAGTERFTLVTTVPSSSPDRDEHHPLRTIVGELAGPTRTRYERILRPSAIKIPERTFHAGRYEPLRQLAGQSVLLIDDTWTTGASAHSAAAALRRAGAGAVGAVVIGRHVNREWGVNDARLQTLTRPYGWERCALGDRCLLALSVRRAQAPSGEAPRTGR